MEKAKAYLKKHILYTSLIHAIGGIGVGIIIASSIAGTHPIRVGVIFLIIALLGHLYPWFT